jgi:hypothetical protein
MAEKPAGSSGARGGAASSGGGGTRIPRDAFVSRLVPDPANLDADPPRVLRGYVGDSDEEGYSRIYCGPELAVYADVRDEDILHYEAATDGGEHTMWARPDAQVKYGRRGAPKSEASGFIDGPLLQDYGAGAGAAAAAAPVGPTGWHGCTQLLGCPNTSTCPPPSQHLIGCTGFYGCGGGTTHQFGCPRTSTCPPTHTPGCVDPTAATMCFICPPITAGPPQCPVADPTAATMCFICPPITSGQPQCPPRDPTAATMCFICPPITSGQPQCPPRDPTAATMCFICPPITAACPQQAQQRGGGGGAELLAAAPAAGAAAQTSFQLCNVTLATVCTQIGCRTHYPVQCTHLFHCPQNTTATVCTHYGCPHGTAATVCTHYGCPPPATFQVGCTFGFTCTAIGCPPPIG